MTSTMRDATPFDATAPAATTNAVGGLAAPKQKGGSAAAARGTKPNSNTNKTKLPIQSKRTAALTWFLSTDRIADLPTAKPFVRVAANDLNLRELRRERRQALRKGNETKAAEIEDKVKEMLALYRPLDFAAVRKQKRMGGKGKGKRNQKKQANKNGKVAAIAEICIVPAQIRSILLAYFDDARARTTRANTTAPTANGTSQPLPLGRYLRDNGLLSAKPTIMYVVRSIRFRRMINDGTERDVVTAKLDAALEEMVKEQQEKIVSKKKALRLAMRQENKKQRAATIAAGNIGKIGKIGKVALKKQNRAKVTPFAAGTPGTNISPGDAQLLSSMLTEWYRDDEMRPIGAFLKSKGHPNLRPLMLDAVSRLGLRKLRKDRHALDRVAQLRIDQGSSAVAIDGADGGAFVNSQMQRAAAQLALKRNAILAQKAPKAQTLAMMDVAAASSDANAAVVFPSAPPADDVEEEGGYVAVVGPSIPSGHADEVSADQDQDKNLDFVVLG